MAKKRIQLLRIDDLKCRCLAHRDKDLGPRIIELRFDMDSIGKTDDEVLTVWCGNCNSRINDQRVIEIAL